MAQVRNQSLTQSINDPIILACVHRPLAAPSTSDVPTYLPSWEGLCYIPVNLVSCVLNILVYLVCSLRDLQWECENGSLETLHRLEFVMLISSLYSF